MLQFKSLQQFPHLFHAVYPEGIDDPSVRENLVTLHQVHENNVIIVTPDFTGALEGDGLITQTPDVFLTIKTADCAPVFLFDSQQNVIGIVHIGWQGATKGIHHQALGILQNNFHSSMRDIIVGIGPAICGTCYTFSQMPQQAHDPAWKNYLWSEKNIWHVDLKGYIKQELVKAGIQPKSIEDMNICTYEDTRFASHRRTRATGEPEGSLISVIGIKNN